MITNKEIDQAIKNYNISTKDLLHIDISDNGDIKEIELLYPEIILNIRIEINNKTGWEHRYYKNKYLLASSVKRYGKEQQQWELYLSKKLTEETNA